MYRYKECLITIRKKVLTKIYKFKFEVVPIIYNSVDYVMPKG